MLTSHCHIPYYDVSISPSIHQYMSSHFIYHAKKDVPWTPFMFISLPHIFIHIIPSDVPAAVLKEVQCKNHEFQAETLIRSHEIGA